ncbi:amidohydrolase family protein [Pseudonocardia sp. GCM10023141]|uniref:amidohydrolase family protein n=1 Tax=Pseudonocardia sp. GCM10023141 TaxID=3252653 RepID=UPI003608CD9C
MDIVDGQLHANQIGPNWRDSDLDSTVDATIVAMDAVGVNAAVIDEFTGLDEEFHMLPGGRHSNGAWRPERPFSQLAVSRYPHRFVWLSRVDHKDPDLEEVVAGLRKQPGCAGIRVHSGFDGNVWRDLDFEAGGYSRLFAACQDARVPVFIMVTPHSETLERYLLEFPDLVFVIDHIGIAWPDLDVAPTERYARLDKIRRLSEYGNLHLKWSHVERLAHDPYPYPDLIPHFRKVVDSYGAERILWASDHTQAVKAGLSPHPAPYSHSLHYLLDCGAFSSSEKEWMLGRAVRKVLDWSV